MELTNQKQEIECLIDKAKKNKKIIAFALFGSSLKGKGRDVDVCVFLDKKLPNKEMSKIRFELLSHCKEGIDIQIFQQLPIYIRSRIMKEGKIIFSKDDNRLYEIAFETINEFNMFKKLYDIYLNKVANG